ncbi:MAG: hypothetical protein A2836_01295 [Candidatus Taylorbacteria bacterium RIFCSPHIGHO2_01_FULL_45_63]|uniref:Superoxide dismutase n=1 Tax=Candidatus Taylorbacteria bacterium RIFCSPHIGHO2_02_FULL_45_35 TaxID=1802311 RepID=A0A1G2MPW7_9BACT|nr:MAG: hypothetical protein A2836_01295 [Candidatus Taylorbacteria bacterium RIFCSPHIGHO2_01_FULL_45_63]OHA25784.1 MAG: hypothetical protein A3D56_01625 [Candidatus Taylorbacteria bacterium RIFCSPHIGHO2_02_FULL_45_35]OHA32301.1 MAG: hypothetical protein A3A22_01840 [Candidatus Taylorbacteria bacterium RIFCSPLOWO2_01_FULL_45_34b]
MKKFEEQKFTIPELKGISKKTIEEHLKLYAGYVKHANLILEHIDELAKNAEKYAYELGELQRRFSFEFNGMVNHEYYFESLAGGAVLLPEKSELKKMIVETSGSFDAWLNRFKSIALTRGIGWAILYYDPLTKRLLNAWVDEQHLGQLNGCKTILALDMWEHSYVADYQPSGKKTYIEDFFANLNWSVIEKNFSEAFSR